MEPILMKLKKMKVWSPRISTMKTWSLLNQANHAFEPNARYGNFSSPRFGPICCVYAKRDIDKGEEIFVNYGYGVNKVVSFHHMSKSLFCNFKSLQQNVPTWYQEAYREHIDKNKEYTWYHFVWWLIEWVTDSCKMNSWLQ